MFSDTSKYSALSWAWICKLDKGPEVPQPGSQGKKAEASSGRNLDSFLGQLLQQQQEMMQQAQQTRQEQMQIQQQVMHLMARMAAPAEMRTPSPTMGAMSNNPMGMQVFRT